MQDAELSRARTDASRQGSDQQKENVKLDKALKKATSDLDSVKARARSDVQAIEQRLSGMEGIARQIAAAVSSLTDELSATRKQIAGLKTSLN